MAQVALQTSNTFAYTFAPVAGGTGYIIAANNNPIFNIGGESWTIECWIKPTGAYAAEYGLFGRRQGTTTSSSYYGYLTATSGFISYYNGTAYTSAARVTPNVWNHVAYVFNNGANLRIFLNGTNVLTTTAVTSVTNVDATLSVGSAIGGLQYYGDISNFRIVKGQALYTGNFDVSAFPVQLPNNAIGSHVGATNVAASLTGNVIFLTCNDQYLKTNGNTAPLNTFTIYGDVVPHAVDTKELQNFSYFFPPSSNCVICTNNVSNSLNLNADFTVEMWYYPTSNSGVLLERGFRGFRNNSASYILIWDTTNNNLNFAAANANNNTYSVGALTGSTGSLGSPTINSWNHIAVTRAGNNYRGFLNGNLNFTSLNNANTPYFASLHGISIGGAFPAGVNFAEGMSSNNISGYISNLRIIRGNSVYNAAFTPSTTQLPNVTNTILLTALTPALQDLSGQFTLTSNSMSGINISTLSPFTANSVANANAANVSFGTAAQGNRLIRIYNKFNYDDFAQMVNIYPAMGNKQGRIYAKGLSNTEFAYMPVPTNRVTTGNTQYEFWS